MSPKPQFFGLRNAAKPALAGLLVALLVWLVVFAATSSFHESLHADSPSGDHCAICLFAHSQVDSVGFLVLSIAFVALCIGLVPVARQINYTSTDRRLAPSRAPPRFSRSYRR